jgi:hypothetical protein
MACLSLKLIPTITIYPTKDAYGKFWHVEIKCEYPSKLDRKEKLKLRKELGTEDCRRHCHYDIDREGLDRLLRTFFSEEFQKNHTYIVIPEEKKQKGA